MKIPKARAVQRDHCTPVWSLALWGDDALDAQWHPSDICLMTSSAVFLDGNTARLARRSDEALGVREVSPVSLPRFLTLDSHRGKSHRYTQYDENTAHQLRAMRLAAMAHIMRVTVSPLSFTCFSALNAEKKCKTTRLPPSRTGFDTQRGRFPIFTRESRRTMSLVGRFSRGSPIYPWPRWSPTKTNRVRFPTGSPPDHRMWESCRQIFSGISRFPALAFRRCSNSPRFTPMDHAVKNSPNIFTS
ncbi:hypothetical protein PR048_017663 [Dryococelus australis]|uniref:Uncharacterized protein n=1 Tax=Dryococelus australis TaxID=614101 RepID=A0ABQ9HA55_9NEOP|nr:hypothetical protein PR048_017663 [Dryococelus australis]